MDNFGLKLVSNKVDFYQFDKQAGAEVCQAQLMLELDISVSNYKEFIKVII